MNNVNLIEEKALKRSIACQRHGHIDPPEADPCS